jgi:hypothetical protein
MTKKREEPALEVTLHTAPRQGISLTATPPRPCAPGKRLPEKRTRRKPIPGYSNQSGPAGSSATRCCLPTSSICLGMASYLLLALQAMDLTAQTADLYVLPPRFAAALARLGMTRGRYGSPKP